MNCDIHVCCEHKNYFNDKWINCDHFRHNPCFEKYEDEKEWEIVPIYDDRNYALFATLANVRNYGENTPISEPRGLPKDVHKITKQLADDWGIDGHSHSYFTLRELLSYIDTAPIFTYSGMVSAEQARDLDEYHIFPDSWCQWTNMGNYVQRAWTKPNDNLDDLIEAMKTRCSEVFYLWDDENRIKRHANKLRIVFWFDN